MLARQHCVTLMNPRPLLQLMRRLSKRNTKRLLAARVLALRIVHVSDKPLEILAAKKGSSLAEH